VKSLDVDLTDLTVESTDTPETFQEYHLRILGQLTRASYETLLEYQLRILANKYARLIAARVIRCPYCSESFVKEGKRKYCSPTCSNRARQKRFHDKAMA
jgi:tRNA(Ile2) C34 agmatinyltransferase TiaS